jgi:hypothetical protein
MPSGTNISTLKNVTDSGSNNLVNSTSTDYSLINTTFPIIDLKGNSSNASYASNASNINISNVSLGNISINSTYSIN